MTKTMELPKLEWKDGKADVSKWFGEGAIYKPTAGYKHERKLGYYDPAYGAAYICTFDAKQAAQAHFESRLQEPMDFGAAMAAVARGCKVIREYDRTEGLFFPAPEAYLFLHDHSNGDCVMRDTVCWNDTGLWSLSKADITATDWHFYFPPKQARVEAIIERKRERWVCPACGCDNDDVISDTESIKCQGQDENGILCGITLHRKGA